MANEFSCYEQTARNADERGAAGASWTKSLAAVEPDPARASYIKIRRATLGTRRAQGTRISPIVPAEHLAPAAVDDGNPPDSTMFGADFYHAACVAAHTRLVNQENSAAATPPVRE